MSYADKKDPIEFRVMKGEVLFIDGEDSVSIHYLQRLGEMEWENVFQLTLEGGRSWGDEIDYLYHHNERPGELLVHVSGYGYWGDTEYYRSLDGGLTWQPTTLRRLMDPPVYTKEKLVHVE
jgi:hypothetical protein